MENVDHLYMKSICEHVIMHFQPIVCIMCVFFSFSCVSERLYAPSASVNMQKVMAKMHSFFSSAHEIFLMRWRY